jgi:DNA-binding MarR family transcriptional regulator
MQEQFKLFTGLVASINRNIRKVKTEIMAEHNLKCPHVSPLYFLYIDKALTLKQLCEKCNEDKGVISRSVKSLEKEGLVDTNFISKKYKNKLRLTEAGEKVGKDIYEKIDDAIIYATQGLTEDDKDCVYRLLGLINKNLHDFKITKE